MKISVLLFLLLLTGSINAQNIEVTGAGTSEVNGYYLPGGTNDGVTYYQKGSIYIYRQFGYWRIGSALGSFNIGSHYYWSVTANQPSPAGLGYSNSDGASGLAPMPTVSNTALPVELTSFTASIINNGITLKWQTSTEKNNYGFEVERLQDYKVEGLQGWNIIGFVTGSGNSNAIKEYSFIDDRPEEGTVYYRLKQLDTDGAFEYSDAIEVSFAAPAEFALEQNYPNPFNPATNIQFQVAEPGLVTLKIYDLLGNEVAALVNETKEPGKYNIQFDASLLSSGIYYYTLKAGELAATKKFILMK